MSGAASALWCRRHRGSASGWWLQEAPAPLLGIDETRLREEANVTYWREPEKAASEVHRHKAHLAFFLNPTHVEDVKAIADARSRMPQKSTDFYPKLLSGIVINDLRPEGAM